jgi:serine phosphatase RsbU (regulator of sigma subunit)
MIGSFVQTRVFPLVFTVACVLFGLLFFMFYSLVFSSVDQIFAKKGKAKLVGIGRDIAYAEEGFRRSAKRLHIGRGVQRLFANIAVDSTRASALYDLQEALQVWHKQQDKSFGYGTYLDKTGHPIVAIDFSASRNQTIESAKFTKELETSSHKSPQALRVDPQILQTWTSGVTPRLGTFALTLPNNEVVFRTVYPVADRKTRKHNGFLGLDRPLASVFSWMSSEGESLIILDSLTGRIVYDSSILKNSSYLFSEQYPNLISASYSEFDEDIPPYAKISSGGMELLITKALVKEVGWELIHVTELNVFIKAPKERGRLLIIGALIFVIVAGSAIYVLTNRVQTRSNELEKANEIVLQHSNLLEQELQTAHEMQMRLMPQSNPEVTGYEVVGLCRPATQVGGDFFQYFSVGQDKWVFALADVTGHGMQAAIPSMVFSGLLDTEISYSPTPETLMPKLNTSLCRVLEPRTFVCLSLGELDSANNTMRISNGGCPYPYIYRSAADSIEEVALSAFPLGVRANSTYDVSEVKLGEGDVVVFCSDGIIEAMSENGELFGFERVAHIISQGGSKSESAQYIVDNLFKELDAFAFGREQDDDQTVVVVRAQGHLAAT